MRVVLKGGVGLMRVDVLKGGVGLMRVVGLKGGDR